MRLVVQKTRRVPMAVAAVHNAAKKLTARAAVDMQKRARKLIEDSVGSGTQHPNLPNRSSAPGEIPVEQSGALGASFKTENMPLGPKIAAADCYSDDPALDALEMGRPKLAPRPFFSQAVEAGKETLANAAPKLKRELNNL